MEIVFQILVYCMMKIENAIYQCYLGYILNNDRQCEKINIKNCAYLKADNNNECEECFGGYELENGVCKLENNNYIEGCDIENAVKNVINIII